MTASARKSVLVLLLAAVGCAAEGPVGDTEGSTWATRESALAAVECIPPADPDQAICSGTIPAVSSCFVSLGSDRLRREIGQTFTVNRKGQAGRVRLKLKRLQELPLDPSEQSDLLIELRTVTDGFIPLDPASTFASARIKRDRLLSLPSEETFFEVYLTSAPPPLTKVMDPKEQYALVVRIEEGHTMAIGIACHEDPEGSEVPYANGRAYSRQMRKMNATEFTDPQFIADTRDLSFSLSLDDGCIKDKMIDCGIGECATTVPQCIEGIPQDCVPLPPTAEVCDLLDNDCDGEIDELADLARPSDTCGVGECRRTIDNCVNGVEQMCTPLPAGFEVCNGKDDNCDGRVDEVDILDRTTCGDGVCQVTVDNCVGGAANPCNPNTGARTTESCNGLDDDCDGSFDEGTDGMKLTKPYWPGSGATRGVGACKDGVETCAAPRAPTPHVPVPEQWAVTTPPILPSAEVCNNKDDDCDGAVDENLFNDCWTGNPSKRGVGICKDGKSQCSAGTWGVCLGETPESTETCNGKDDDCNGIVDDGLGETFCGLGVCRRPTLNCVNGMPNACTPDFSKQTTEVCNNLDDDCNGVIDKNTEDCYTPGNDSWKRGVCRRGTQTCTAGVWGSCEGQVIPSGETCNNLDDDCDGVIDNPSTSICIATPGTNVTATNCGAGNCSVTACRETATVKYYDYNGVFSDGCEVAADKHANACGSAAHLVTMGMGTARPHTVAGYLPEASQSDWFVVAFPEEREPNNTWYVANPNAPYSDPANQTKGAGRPYIYFSENPGDQFRFRVIKNDCVSPFDAQVGTTCGSGTDKLTTWTFQDNACVNQGNPKCVVDRAAWPSTVRIEVFHKDRVRTNARYVLAISR